MGWPQTIHAQVGGMIVFDPANFVKNTITAAQMILQVINSTKEVRLMLQNLDSTRGTWEDTVLLLRRLDEVVATGEALHYQLSTLDQTMQQRYPGFEPPGQWWPAYQRWTTTSLDTLRGTLVTVHEQMKETERLREEALLAELKTKTDNAAGNLDVTQTTNMIALQIVEEQRKIRQLLGALINAQNVAQAHHINREAVGERVQHDLLERSAAVPIPTRAEGNSIHFFEASR